MSPPATRDSGSRTASRSRRSAATSAQPLDAQSRRAGLRDGRDPTGRLQRRGPKSSTGRPLRPSRPLLTGHLSQYSALIRPFYQALDRCSAISVDMNVTFVETEMHLVEDNIAEITYVLSVTPAVSQPQLYDLSPLPAATGRPAATGSCARTSPDMASSPACAGWATQEPIAVAPWTPAPPILAPIRPSASH